MMRPKWPKRRRRRRFTFVSSTNIMIVTIILFVVSIIGSMIFIDRAIKPTLMSIAEIKTDEFATRAINSAVRFVEDYDFEDVLEITYDNQGNVVTYNWDPAVVSEINRVATDRVEEYFRHVNRGEPMEYENPLQEPYEYGDGAEGRAEQDPTLIEIPLGQATGNTVLANLGPKIPVNLELVGNVRTNVVREDEEFGINGAFVSVYIEVETDVQIIIPFTTEVTTVKTDIYVDGGVIMGAVPDFYSGGGDDPSIAIPKENLQEE